MSGKLSVDNALLLNRTAGELRAVLVEGGVPTSFYVERARARGIVGNIYKGRVVRIVPGMQAAFIELGLERAGFLYVGDVVDARAEASAEQSLGGIYVAEPSNNFLIQKRRLDWCALAFEALR